MTNFTKYKGFNTYRNSHVNLNTNMPIPPHPNLIKNNHPKFTPYSTPYSTPYVSGSFNRVPPPPRLNNNA